MTANDLNMVTPSTAGRPSSMGAAPKLSVRWNQISGNLFLEICYYPCGGRLEFLQQNPAADEHPGRQTCPNLPRIERSGIRAVN
ncbi:MAG TPA: hypothetical protein VG795_05365, partial [Acidimicrobiia bacterium]|nr:hypothetical protein [Acidimicrobiia bacterium]